MSLPSSPAPSGGLTDAELWRGRRFRLSNYLSFLWSRPLALLGIVLLFLLLLGVLLWILLIRPPRTPFIFVNGGTYGRPFPPNAWAAEDMQRLKFLDETQTLMMTTIDVDRLRRPQENSGVDLRQSILNALTFDNVRAALKLDSEQFANSDAVIFYISMHGIVDGDKPYLVPAGASPHEPATWLSLEDVLNQITGKPAGAESPSGYPADQHKLIVLDCHRLQTNWQLGLLRNDFSAAVRDWWDGNRSNYPNISILAAAAPGERAEVSSDLQGAQGSVFGHFFALGLAGEADDGAWTFFRPASVSLQELDNYLRRNVADWTSYRGGRQTPLLLSDEANVVLAQASSQRPQPSWRAPVVSATERQALWQALENLRPHALHRFEPVAWHDLEQRLLWLEQLAESGTAYGRLARDTADGLAEQLEGIEGGLAQTSDAPALRQFTRLISRERDDSIPSDLKLHSLPLAEYFGTLDPDVVATAVNQLAQFGLAPSPVQLDRALRGLDRLGLSDYVEHRFLWMLQRYQFSQLWQEVRLLAKLLHTRALAEELARPRGAAGEPGDERAHRWLRAVLDVADEVRRAAEDQLWIDGQPELEAHVSEAAKSYEATQQTSDQLGAAFRTRDRAWTELAYYAQWLTSPVNSANADAIRKLHQAAEKIRVLEDLLADQSQMDAATSAGRIARIVDTAKEVDVDRKALSDILEDQDNNLTELRSIEAVLRVPHLSTGRRHELRRLYEEIASGKVNQDDARSGQLAQDPAEDNPAAGNNVASTGSMAGAELSQTSQTSPIDDPIDGGDSTTAETPDGNDPSSDVQPDALKWVTLFGVFTGAQDEVTVDTWRKKWWEEAHRLAAQIEQAERDGASREVWTELDQRARAWAPFWYREPKGASTLDIELPVHTLRQLDLQELLAWHAERARRDFWGPAGQRRSFFELAATDYLSSAERFGVKSPSIEDIRKQVSSAVAAARDWLATAAQNDVLLEPGDDARTQIRVSVNRSNEARPPGTAAVLLRRNGLRINKPPQFRPYGGVKLPADAESVEARIPNESVQSVPAELDATTMFRGHEYSTRFVIEPFGGLVVDHNPYEYEPGRVILHSPWNTLAVMLVIDCSQSMEQELEPGKSRLAVAKEALQQLLSRIGSQRNVRVGVRLFGHRVGWSTERPVRMVTSPTYAGPLAQGLSPERDVERVLPLDDFDYQSAQQVFAALEAVKQGWGQSPLYYSLAQSLREDFVAEVATTQQHIIVITDGRNYQYRPTAEERTGLDGVLQARSGRPVRIHILGLAIEAEEDRAAAAEFVRLANQAGGVFRNLDTGLDLQATLHEILAPESYQLERSDRSLVDQGELGVPLRDAAQRSPDWYVVRKDQVQEPIWLEGGEEIDLYYRPGDNRLHAFAYNHEVEGAAVIRSDFSGLGGNYALRAHRPVRSDRDVHFPLSLQRFGPAATDNRRDIWQWTPRPAEAWIEITPLLDSDRPADAKYYFYDANWEQEKPVPALRLVARDWPAGFSRAVIQVWFKSPATAPTIVLPLSDVVTAQDGATQPVEREVAPGISIQLDAGFVDANLCVDMADRTQMSTSTAATCYRIRVVERHHSPSASISALKVFLPQGDGVRPSHVSRQFDQRHGLVVHSFYYANPNNSLLTRLQTAEIGIAPRETALAGALSAPEMVVDISEAGNFLPLVGQWTQVE